MYKLQHMLNYRHAQTDIGDKIMESLKANLGKLRVVFVVIAILLSSFVIGNNLQVSTVTRLDNGGARDLVKFSVGWENSWYVTGAPANYDAIWLFVKFRECGTNGEWCHAYLAKTSGKAGQRQASGHIISTDSSLVLATDIDSLDRRGKNYNGKHHTGAMIRRSSIGTGDISAKACTLKIVGSSVDSAFDAAIEFDIKVFGIEMVQIPEGSYYLGDGVSTRMWETQANIQIPFHVDSGEETEYLARVNDANITIPDSCAMAYQEFFCMKYELTQGQYANFLNTLNSAKQNARYDAYNSWGSHMSVLNGVYYSNYPNRAILYGSYYDWYSYYDWACLRPMSEVEFEKVCRGPGFPIQWENVWGEADATNFVEAKTVTVPLEGQMTCDEVGANVNSYNTSTISGYPAPQAYGPLEVGVFARDGDETRTTTGASYYGAMEMAGNVWEVCVNIRYRCSMWVGVWGDGHLSDATSNFDVQNWVDMAAGGNYDLIKKGGSYADNYGGYFHISYRGLYSTNVDANPSTDRGVRGVR